MEIYLLSYHTSEPNSKSVVLLIFISVCSSTVVCDLRLLDSCSYQNSHLCFLKIIQSLSALEQFSLYIQTFEASLGLAGDCKDCHMAVQYVAE